MAAKNNYTPTDAEKETLKYVTDRWNAAKQNHDEHARVFEAYDIAYEALEYKARKTGKKSGKPNDLYETLADNDIEENVSRFYIPWIFQQIETLKPRFYQQDEEFNVVPRKDGQALWDSSRLIQKLLSYQMDRTNISDVRGKIVDETLVHGIGIGKAWWDEDVVIEKDHPETSCHVCGLHYEIVTDQTTGEKDVNCVNPDCDNYMKGVPPYITNITKNSDPLCDHVPIWDFFWDPAADRIDNCRYVFHRIWMTKEELEAKANRMGYKNVDCVADTPEIATTEQGRSSNAIDRKKGLLPVVEMWTPTRRIVFVQDGMVLLHEGDNPYWHGKIPFVRFVTQEVTGQFVGRAEVWALIDFQRVINEMDNAQLDAIHRALNPPLEVEKGLKGIEKYTGRPGQKVEVDQIGRQIGVLNTSNLGAAQNMINSSPIIDRMEAITGITKALSASPAGGYGSGASTATEALAQQQQSSERVALKVNKFNQAMAKLAELFLAMNKQFMTEERSFMMTGFDPLTNTAPVWGTITPEAVRQQYEFKIRSATDVINKELTKQHAMEMINTLAQFNGVPIGDGSMMVDITPALKNYAIAMNMDPSQFVVPAPAPEPMVDPNASMPVEEMPVEEPVMEEIDPMAEAAAALGLAPEDLMGMEEEFDPDDIVVTESDYNIEDI